MYFAILGKNPEISKAELELVQPTNISYPKKGIIVFETKYPEKISTLGGIIKAGSVVKERDLPTILENTKIIGIKEEANGKHLKKTIGIKRFKLVDLFHTDKEIKEKGVELINLGNGDYGRVEQYQNISLYETIDFDKPARSMQMGMMPAKLAHIMINIGLSNLESVKSKVPQVEGSKTGRLDRPEDFQTTIYDPFTGSGTTGFLANALGYDFIGSDINITYAEKNIERWKTTNFYQKNHKFLLIEHDIDQPRKHGQPETMFEGMVPQLIITEGRLGPIITDRSTQEDISRAQNEVQRLYEGFIIQIHNLFFSQTEKPIIVCTIPQYFGENHIEDGLKSLLQDLPTTWQLSSISEVYKRENQNIGRKIIIISPKP